MREGLVIGTLPDQPTAHMLLNCDLPMSSSHLLFLAAILIADDGAPAPRALTFDAALGLTAATPKVVGTARSAEEKAALDRQISALPYNPQLTVMPGWRFAPRDARQPELVAEIIQPWNFSGQPRARRQTVALEERVLQTEARVAALASRLSAARAWINVWAAEHVLEETRREERIAAELERLVDRAAALGAMTRADLAEARAYHAEARVAVLNAEGEAFQSGLTLAREVGAPEGLPLRAEGALPAAPVPSSALRSDYLQRMNALPAVALKDFQARAARARAVEEEAARGTIAQLGAVLQRDAPGGLVISGIARVTFPIFDRGERERAGLHADATRLEGERGDALVAARTELAARFHEVDHTADLLSVLRDDSRSREPRGRRDAPADLPERRSHAARSAAVGSNRGRGSRPVVANAGGARVGASEALAAGHGGRAAGPAGRGEPMKTTVARFRLAGWLLLVAACRSDPPPSTAPPAPAARTSVAARWVSLRAPDAASFLELPAFVLMAAGNTGLVNPPYPGQIVKLYVRAGEHVKRGQAVAEIRMPTVVAAAGEHAAARTKLEAYQARMQQLNALKAEGLVRSIEIAEAEMRLAEARADQERTGAILRSAGAAPEQARRLAESGGAVALRSPIDGVVTEVSAALGETRDTAGAPLVRIAGTAPARIEARTTQRFPDGARFEFVIADGERIAVHFLGEAPVVDARDGTAASWFEPAPMRNLPGGLTGKLRIIPPKKPGLTIAPRSALGGDAEIAFVQARGPSGATKVSVKIVMSSGADALIESSLPAGAEIAERAP